ncbi:MAG: carbon monoxide dehydrogenase subunit G [Hyphomicrobiales bacterium]|nr:carbon monoxide dehydrogenase subunit G [Hyphomicrobiales bacterium]
MKLAGEKILPLSQDKVWSALNDPKILQDSIPGCESFETVSENNYRAVVAMKIGPVQAKFNGTVNITDIDPPSGYTLSGQGTGGSAGSAKGSAVVRLEPAEGGTRLTWDADARISGKLAQIGSRLVESSANMMANQFFGRFEQLLAGEKPSDAPVIVSAFLPSWFRIAGLISLLLVILLIIFLMR